jgi:hypothetical protein
MGHMLQCPSGPDQGYHGTYRIDDMMKGAMHCKTSYAATIHSGPALITVYFDWQSSGWAAHGVFMAEALCAPVHVSDKRHAVKSLRLHCTEDNTASKGGKG